MIGDTTRRFDEGKCRESHSNGTSVRIAPVSVINIFEIIENSVDKRHGSYSSVKRHQKFVGSKSAVGNLIRHIAKECMPYMWMAIA